LDDLVLFFSDYERKFRVMLALVRPLRATGISTILVHAISRVLHFLGTHVW